tara:strand:+ start:2774 stop:3283 length:510 start_codon:yes stop_codon:yes gene_type:complete
MITLTRKTLTNLLNANKQIFINFPLVEAYCAVQTLPESQVHFSQLVSEATSNPEFRGKIEECLGSSFELDNEVYEIMNGVELVYIIRNNNITISEGEESWISNLERIRDTLQGGACCSTRAALNQEGRHCYEDLVNQCDSDWIFVKNIKSSVGASKIIFHYHDDRFKTV